MLITSIKKIKDPIHGYVHYSKIEEGFLNHPLLLRLHHIRQNGAAFLTYPSMRVHRFEHSLGAMHIAGEMFHRGIRFSTDPNAAETLPKLLEELGHPVDEIIAAITRNTKDTKGKIFVEEDGLYKLYGLNNINDLVRFAELLLFQAVRIAALVHDIGHPPFSHTFEAALKQRNHKLYRNHEIVGIDILRIIIGDIKANKLFQRGQYDLAKPAADLAAIILNKADPSHGDVIGLAEIVSSDIDCDRLDYVRRDAQSAGLAPNAYDLGRMYDAIKLTVRLKGKRHRIELRWTAQALSFIEAFFSVRFHLYRWALWHHNVVRQNMGLIIIASCLDEVRRWKLKYLNPINAEIADIFDLALNKKRRREYWYFTDYYLLTKLSKIFSFLDDNKSDWRAKKNQIQLPRKQWGIVADLHKFLRTFLYRDKTWLTPFWKRPDDYEEFAVDVLGKGRGQSSKLNDKLEKLYKRIVKKEANKLSKNVSSRKKEIEFRNEYSDYLVGKINRVIEVAINDSLEALGSDRCRVRAYYQARFSPFPRDLKLLSDGSEHDVKTLSPSVAGLETAWKAVPHLWLFREFYAFEENGDEATLPIGDAAHLKKVKHLAAGVLRNLLSNAAGKKRKSRK